MSRACFLLVASVLATRDVVAMRKKADSYIEGSESHVATALTTKFSRDLVTIAEDKSKHTLDVLDLLAECGTRKHCSISIKTEKYNCDLLVDRTSKGKLEHITLRKCRKRKHPPKQVADGFAESSCCTEWNVPSMTGGPGSACASDVGCAVKKCAIRVLTNEWKKVAIAIDFARVASRDGRVKHCNDTNDDDEENADDKGGDHDVAMFREAHLKLKKRARFFKLSYWPDKSYDEIHDDNARKRLKAQRNWLGSHFRQNGDSVLQAVAALTEPDFGMRPDVGTQHPMWIWATGTSVDHSAPVDPADPAHAGLGSIAESLPIASLLPLCDADNKNCHVSVKSVAHKCILRMSPPSDKESCFFTLRHCKARQSFARSDFPPHIGADLLPNACKSKGSGCCVPSSAVTYDNLGSGLRLKVALSAPESKSISIDFQESRIVARSKSWACERAGVNSALCGVKLLPLATVLEADYTRSAWCPWCPKVGGTKALQLVTGVRFPETMANKAIELEMCMNQGLAQAVRLRTALMFKAVSGLVAAVSAFFIGPFNLLVKLFIRILAGGHYAEATCIFEVSSVFPALRDQLFAPRKYWGWVAKTEVSKCMDTKNKLFRQAGSIVSMTKVTRKTGGGVAAVAATTWAMSLSTAGVALMSGTLALATTALALLGELGATAISIGGTSIPMLSLFMGVTETIAGVFQAQTVYNWARFTTYADCSIGRIASMDSQTQAVTTDYESLRKDGAKDMSDLQQQMARSKVILTCATAQAMTVTHGKKAMLDYINKAQEKLLTVNNALSAQLDTIDDELVAIHKEVIVQDALIKEIQNRQHKEYKKKERREFIAELALNTPYFIIEGLFPQNKYVVDELDIRDAENETKIEQSQLTENEIPAKERKAKGLPDKPSLTPLPNGDNLAKIHCTPEDGATGFDKIMAEAFQIGVSAENKMEAILGRLSKLRPRVDALKKTIKDTMAKLGMDDEDLHNAIQARIHEKTK